MITQDDRAFTLIELLVVVVIIGIISSMAIPSYMNTKEKAFDREAVSVLKLIQIAQKQYYARYETYYSGTTAAGINGNLSLNINFNTWNYSTANGGAGTGYRKNRLWSIMPTDTNATCFESSPGACLN